MVRTRKIKTYGFIKIFKTEISYKNSYVFLALGWSNINQRKSDVQKLFDSIKRIEININTLNFLNSFVSVYDENALIEKFKINSSNKILNAKLVPEVFYEYNQKDKDLIINALIEHSIYSLENSKNTQMQDDLEVILTYFIKHSEHLIFKDIKIATFIPSEYSSLDIFEQIKERYIKR